MEDLVTSCTEYSVEVWEAVGASGDCPFFRGSAPNVWKAVSHGVGTWRKA